jgi:hypothetical protein
MSAKIKMNTQYKNNEILFLTGEQWERGFKTSIEVLVANLVVVDGIVYKNRYGPVNIPYSSDKSFSFGTCRGCNKEVKQRDSFLEQYIGCMC